MNDEKLIPKLRFEFSSNWESKKLKDIIQISKEKYNPDSDRTNYKCIELEHLAQETGLLLGYTDSINQNSIKNKFHEDNILFGKLRPYLKKFYYTNFVGVCSSEIWVFDTKEYSKYIYYLIQTKRFLDISNVSSGSKMPRSDWNFMKDFVFLIPDIKTQKETANLFSMIDNKIGLLEKKYKFYQDFKKFLMQQIFAQKLRFNFSDEWKIVKLESLIKKGKAGGTPSSTNSDYYNGDIPFLSIRDMTEQGKYILKTEKTITEEGLNNSSAWIIPKNSLLYSIYASIGLVAINRSDISTSQAIYGIILKEGVSLEYMYYYLTYFKKNIHKYIETGTQGNLNAKLLKSFEILLPSLEEQEMIVNVLSIVDEKIENSKKEIEKINEFKKGLLQQMFNNVRLVVINLIINEYICPL